MQLILETETSDISDKMTSISQEPFNERLNSDIMVQDLKNDLSVVNKDMVQTGKIQNIDSISNMDVLHNAEVFENTQLTLDNTHINIKKQTEVNYNETLHSHNTGNQNCSEKYNTEIKIINVNETPEVDEFNKNNSPKNETSDTVTTTQTELELVELSKLETAIIEGDINNKSDFKDCVNPTLRVTTNNNSKIVKGKLTENLETQITTAIFDSVDVLKNNRKDTINAQEKESDVCLYISNLQANNDHNKIEDHSREVLNDIDNNLQTNTDTCDRVTENVIENNQEGSAKAEELEDKGVYTCNLQVKTVALINEISFENESPHRIKNKNISIAYDVDKETVNSLKRINNSDKPSDNIVSDRLSIPTIDVKENSSDVSDETLHEVTKIMPSLKKELDTDEEAISTQEHLQLDFTKMENVENIADVETDVISKLLPANNIIHNNTSEVNEKLHDLMSSSHIQNDVNHHDPAKTCSLKNKGEISNQRLKSIVGIDDDKISDEKLKKECDIDLKNEPKLIQETKEEAGINREKISSLKKQDLIIEVKYETGEMDTGEMDISSESLKSNNAPRNDIAGVNNKYVIDCDSIPDISESNVKTDELLLETKVKIENYSNVNSEMTNTSTQNFDLKINESPNDSITKENIIKKTVDLKKKKLPLCKLSNNLDILSDDDDDNLVQNNAFNEKKCINIDDDDDIMLIEEDCNKSSEVKKEIEKCNNKLENSNLDPVDSNDKLDNVAKLDDNLKNEICLAVSQNELTTPNSTSIDPFLKPDINDKENKEESKITEKPLLPANVLKTCKKKLSEMTREDLEEFCILKIVESIVDRSNLSEIHSKLKSMARSIEDHKKKAMLLTKQNRDLQVVLKSVKEEQKKNTKTPITPLKITRSVGMQVLMNDKPGMRRKPVVPVSNSGVVSNIAPVNNSINNTNTRPVRSTANNKATKPNIPQTIPVPRLVPANNLANKTTAQVNPTINTSKTNRPVQNGVRNSPPVPKSAEKRPLNSDTVDLTDDEPPAKTANRSIPPVRLVPPQNLLAPQRQSFSPTTSSPRKVFIPISGPQAQNIKQTLMLKPVPAGTRPRVPGSSQIVRLPQVAPKATRGILRHPAPLPEVMKQYQPPNWKALPPAPDLKLSKVENGIVISWKIENYQENNYEPIASYQLYAYQETSSPPSTTLWKKIGDVKALPLPMACTLTQFMAGYKYYFAVRAVDIRSRLGPFSLPGSILLLNKM